MAWPPKPAIYVAPQVASPSSRKGRRVCDPIVRFVDCEEKVLKGGRQTVGVARVGDTVRRPL